MSNRLPSLLLSLLLTGTLLTASKAAAVGNLDLKVAVVTYNPWMTNVTELSRGRRFNQVFGWPIGLNMAKDHVQWWDAASHGMVKCQLVTNVVLDVWPRFEGGHTFTPQSYYDYRVKKIDPGFNLSFTFDYDYFLTNQCPWIVDYVNRNIIDQVWLYSFPGGGCYETRLFGLGASYCNSPGYGKVDCERMFMMNFPSVERTDTPMENFGHGAESVLATRWYNGNVPYSAGTDFAADNDFFLFTRNYAVAPDNIQVGNVHYAPNSTKDYEWGRDAAVLCYADNWYSYPDLSGAPRLMNRDEWGNGDNHLHKIWWFKHFPQKVGLHRGQMMNWISVYLNPARAAHPIGVNEEIRQEDVDLAGFFPFSFDLPAGTTQAVMRITTGLPVECGIRKRFLPANSRYWEVTGPKPGYDEWRLLKDTEHVWRLDADNCYGHALTGRWYVSFGRTYNYSSMRAAGANTNYAVSLEVWPKPAQKAPLAVEVTKPADGDKYISTIHTIEWECPSAPADGWLSFNLAYSTNDFAGPFTEICEDYEYELQSPFRWKSFPAGVTSPAARIRLIARDRHGNACTNYSGLFGMRTDPVPEPAAWGLLLGLLAGLFRGRRG